MHSHYPPHMPRQIGPDLADLAPTNGARRLSVDVQLWQPRLRGMLTRYLESRPLRPPYRLEPVGTHGGAYLTSPDVRIVHQKGRVKRRRLLALPVVVVVVVVDGVAYGTLSEVIPAWEPGAVVLGDGPIEEIGDAVAAAVHGGCWIAPAVLRRLDWPNLLGASGSVAPGEELTHREHEVLYLVASGRSNMEIAAHLQVATTTIRTHVRAVLRKTGCVNRHQLTAFVHRAAVAR